MCRSAQTHNAQPRHQLSVDVCAPKETHQPKAALLREGWQDARRYGPAIGRHANPTSRFCKQRLEPDSTLHQPMQQVIESLCIRLKLMQGFCEQQQCTVNCLALSVGTTSGTALPAHHMALLATPACRNSKRAANMDCSCQHASSGCLHNDARRGQDFQQLMLTAVVRGNTVWTAVQQQAAATGLGGLSAASNTVLPATWASCRQPGLQMQAIASLAVTDCQTHRDTPRIVDCSSLHCQFGKLRVQGSAGSMVPCRWRGCCCGAPH